MQEVIKYTYLMEPEKVELHLNRLWDRYQQILDEPSWEELNEARSILYFIGHLFSEKIAPEAIQKRLHLLNSPLSLLQFLHLVDSNSEKLEWHRQDSLFQKLERFYFITKQFKNKHLGSKYYLDEERFIELYREHNPYQELTMKYRGKFDQKG